MQEPLASFSSHTDCYQRHSSPHTETGCSCSQRPAGARGTAGGHEIADAEAGGCERPGERKSKGYSRNKCIATRNKCIATRNKCIATRNKCIATRNKCIATRNKCIATRNKCIATRNKCIATRNKCLTSSNKKLNLHPLAHILTYCVLLHH